MDNRQKPAWRMQVASLCAAPGVDFLRLSLGNWENANTSAHDASDAKWRRLRGLGEFGGIVS